MKLVLIVAHTLWLIVFSSAASSQSFDCARASKFQEKLICSDDSLGQLDLQLAASLKRALAAKPEERESLLADERKWVQGRDLICPNSNKALYCLRESYEKRIAVIDKIVASVPADKTLCHRVAGLYRALVKTVTQEANSERTRDILNDPFDALVMASTAGVSKSELSTELEVFSKSTAAAWARKENPPFEFPGRLQKIITGNGSFSRKIERLPGASYYVAYYISGTISCYESNYFTVRGGRAYRAAAPSGWDGDNMGGGDCAVNRFFGMIDGQSAALVSNNHAYTAALGSSLSISRWEKGHFAPACVVNFEFTPGFDIKDLKEISDENHCAGSDCNIKQQAALALAKSVQHSPLEARQTLLAQLTHQQIMDFSGLPKRSQGKNNDTTEADDEDLSDPDTLLADYNPLTVPLVVSGKVCRVSIGHVKNYDWVKNDWKVVMECPDKGKLDEAIFTISMDRGRFVSATVK